VSNVEVRHQTRKTKFEHMSKHREQSQNYDAQRSIFDKLRGAWKFSQTLFLVFDTAVSRKVAQQNRTRQCQEVLWVMGVHGP